MKVFSIYYISACFESHLIQKSNRRNIFITVTIISLKYYNTFALKNKTYFIFINKLNELCTKKV